MRTDVQQFIIDSIAEINYPVDGVDGDTPLGASGIDLESLAIAELAVRVEDEYGFKFAAEDSEEMIAMTIGEFADAVAARAGLTKTS